MLGRTDCVATTSLAHEIVLLVVVCDPGTRIGRASTCFGILLLAWVLW